MHAKKTTNGTNGKGAIIDAETVANLENLDAQATAEELDAELVDAVESENTASAEDASEAENTAKTAMILTVIEAILKARWPFLVINPSVKAEVFEKVHPVFRKYGDGFPDWLIPWQEEIELGVVLSVAGYGIHSQIAAHSEKNKESKPSGNEKKEEYPPQPTTNKNGLQ